MLDTLLPQVQKLISDKSIEMLKKEGPTFVFKSVYTMLPGPVRLMVKEETFISFCSANQDKIFGKSAPAKKVAAKKAPVKKAAAKKAPVKKAAAKKK